MKTRTTLAISRSADLLLIGLLAGTMFGIWIGSNPAGLSAATYLEQQQQMIRAFNTLLPLMGAISILLTTILAVYAGRNPTMRYLLIAAIVCMVFAAVVTRTQNQPINRDVMTWQVQSLPENWAVLRDRWWTWHIVRTVATIGAFCLLIVAFLAEKSPVNN